MPPVSSATSTYNVGLGRASSFADFTTLLAHADVVHVSFRVLLLGVAKRRARLIEYDVDSANTYSIIDRNTTEGRQ